MPADPKQHQHLYIFRHLFQHDIQLLALVVNFNNCNFVRQQFPADEYKIPAQQQADQRSAFVGVVLKEGMRFLLLLVFGGHRRFAFVDVPRKASLPSLV